MTSHLSPLDRRKFRKRLPLNDVHRISNILLKADNQNRFVSHYHSGYNEQQEVQMPPLGNLQSPERKHSPVDLNEDSPQYPSAGVRSSLFRRATVETQQANDLGISPKKKLLKEGVPFSQNIPSLMISNPKATLNPKLSNLVVKNSSLKQLRSRRPLASNSRPPAGLPYRYMFNSESVDNLNALPESRGSHSSLIQPQIQNYNSFENLPHLKIQPPSQSNLPTLQSRVVMTEPDESEYSYPPRKPVKVYRADMPPRIHSRTMSKPPELPALPNPPQVPALAKRMDLSYIPSSQVIAPRIPLKQGSPPDFEKRTSSLGQQRERGQIVHHYNFDRELANLSKDVNDKSEFFYNY